MSAWSHSEWRLLHAYVPAWSEPARDFKTRDEGTEAASLAIGTLERPRAPWPHRAWPRPAQWAKWRISATAERHACSFMLPSVPRGTPHKLSKNKKSFSFMMS
jgi:hypothetical protein